MPLNAIPFINPTVVIPCIHDLRQRQDGRDSRVDIKASGIHVMHALDVFEDEAAVEGRYIPYVHDTALVACKYQVLLEVFVAGAFVEGARGDDFVAFDADMLFKEEVAIEGVESYGGAHAEEDNP